MQKRRALVIGSGVAGMASAIRLVLQGFDVDVYEKNDYPGGKLSAFEKDGFHFDAGPSLFTQPENIAELFELAGEPIEEYFKYTSLPVACNYFFENGKQVTAYTDKEQFAAELNEKLAEPPQKVEAYLSKSAQLYNKIGPVFLDRSLKKTSTWISGKFIKALGGVRLPYLFSTLSGYNKRFSSEETRQIFNRFATYNGSNPYKAPAMLSMIPHLEHNEGVFYPAGGMISITNALHQLAEKKGVKFHFNSPVQTIIAPENKASGIVVNGENIYADIIVSNADAFFTYKDLLHRPNRLRRLSKQERSSSAVVFYWGIKRTFPQLGLHNILFSKNYKEEFDFIFKKKKLYADPTVYINITAKEESSKAPEGCENWFVMINVPSALEYDEENYIKAARQHILNKISKMLDTDLQSVIISEEVLHPKILESRTGAYAGALYGRSSNSRMAAFRRHPNFLKAIRNLYFCGGTVHPGGGIPLCLRSAKIVSDLVKKDISKYKRLHA